MSCSLRFDRSHLSRRGWNPTGRVPTRRITRVPRKSNNKDDCGALESNLGITQEEQDAFNKFIADAFQEDKNEVDCDDLKKNLETIVKFQEKERQRRVIFIREWQTDAITLIRDTRRLSQRLDIIRSWMNDQL